MIAALFAVFLFPSAAYADQRLVLTYEAVAYGVMRIGRARVEIELDDRDYRSRASLRTQGLAALFTKAQLTATSAGQWRREGASFRQYTLDHFHGGGHRDLRVQWRRKAVSVVAAPPFVAAGDPAPTDAQRQEGRDPLATLLSMSARAQEEPCAGTFRVFDGLYVYDLKLSLLRVEPVGPPEEARQIAKCALEQRRVAGYARAADLAKRAPPGEIWFALDPGSPIAVPVRVSSRLPLGEATIKLTSVERMDDGGGREWPPLSLGPLRTR